MMIDDDDDDDDRKKYICRNERDRHVAASVIETSV